MYGDGCVLVSNLQDHDPHCFTLLQANESHHVLPESEGRRAGQVPG
jgi:hypothetical protein